MPIKCPHCGELIEDKMMKEEMVTVRYWRKNSIPYSIDDKPYGTDQIYTMEVPLSETYRKSNGKRYYSLCMGYGTYVELAVE